jgi:hypothetical protein
VQKPFQDEFLRKGLDRLFLRESYESMINLRPRSNNSMEILDPQVRAQVDRVILSREGGV